MSKQDNLRISASPFAYAVLTGIWLVLAVTYLSVYFREGRSAALHGAIATAVIGVACCVWLKGFAITVNDSFLEYRNGLYRHSRIALAEFSSVDIARVGADFLTRQLSPPRLVVRSKAGVSIAINPKPFRRADLIKLVDVLRSLPSSSRVAGAEESAD